MPPSCGGCLLKERVDVHARRGKGGFLSQEKGTRSTKATSPKKQLHRRLSICGEKLREINVEKVGYRLHARKKRTPLGLKVRMRGLV